MAIILSIVTYQRRVQGTLKVTITSLLRWISQTPSFVGQYGRQSGADTGFWKGGGGGGGGPGNC